MNKNFEEKILNTVPEAAELLRVECNTVRQWLCKEKVIPSNIIVRLGSRVLFNRKLLLEWINAGCKYERKEA